MLRKKFEKIMEEYTPQTGGQDGDVFDEIIDRLMEATSDSQAINKLFIAFWKESSELMFKYRDNHQEKEADGVVSCRILINSIYERLKAGREI